MGNLFSYTQISRDVLETHWVAVSDGSNPLHPLVGAGFAADKR